MARIYTAQMRKRDETIRSLYARGWTYKRIADRYGLSTPRIYQILAETGAQRKAA